MNIVAEEGSTLWLPRGGPRRLLGNEARRRYGLSSTVSESAALTVLKVKRDIQLAPRLVSLNSAF